MDWTRDADGLAPSWVRGLGVAAWVVDREGVLTYMNAAAEELLGAPSTSLGAPCWTIVRGRSESGEPRCRESCSIREAARSGASLEPFLMQRARHDTEEGWLLVLPVALDAQGDGSDGYVLHMVVDVGRAQRIEAYMKAALQGVSHKQPAPRELLSPRELEVLERLARNENSKQIARDLSVSYATVRNHVGSILRKLHVHSIQEAVALHLLVR